ncbi:MAG: hypothetical protein LBP31_00525 [Holosporales bacterium]|nr:hypothetical protein [Holosporales bacterium]
MKRHITTSLIAQFFLLFYCCNASSFGDQQPDEQFHKTSLNASGIIVSAKPKTSIKSIAFDIIKEKGNSHRAANSTSPTITSPVQTNEKIPSAAARAAKKWFQKTKQHIESTKDEASSPKEAISPHNFCSQNNSRSNTTIKIPLQTPSIIFEGQQSTNTLPGTQAEFFNLQMDQNICEVCMNQSFEDNLDSSSLESLSQISNSQFQIEDEFETILNLYPEITESPEDKDTLLKFLVSCFGKIINQQHVVLQNPNVRNVLQNFFVQQFSKTLRQHDCHENNNQAKISLSEILKNNTYLTLSPEDIIEFTSKINAVVSSQEKTTNLSLKERVALVTTTSQSSEKALIMDQLLDFADNPLFKPIVLQAAKLQEEKEGFSSQNDQNFLKYSKRLFWANVWGLVSGFTTDIFNIVSTLFWDHYSLMIGMAVTTVSDGIATGYGYRLGSKIKNILNSSQNQSTISFSEAGKETIFNAVKNIMNIHTQINTHITSNNQLYQNNTTLTQHLVTFSQIKKLMDKQTSSIQRGNKFGKGIYAVSILSKFVAAIVNMTGLQGTFVRALSATSLVSSAFSKGVESINQDAQYANLVTFLAQAYISLWDIADELEDTNVV